MQEKCGDFFAISSMLPELHSFKNNEFPNAVNGEYSSENSVISLDETIKLLKVNSLMIEDSISIKNNEELLR